MFLLENTPLLLQYVYRLTGIVQFGTTDGLWFVHRLWCLPLFSYFLYVSVLYITWSRHLHGIFKYVDRMAGYTNLFTMFLSGVVFCTRSKKLKDLLLKLDSIQIYNGSKRLKHNYWISLGMFAITIMNTSCFHFVFLSYHSSFFYWIPPFVCGLDHLFLNDILSSVSYKFEQINQQFQRQINSVDLFAIFPLTKVEKIRVLKEDEVTFNIQRIQELSHLHYQLVRLSTKICNLFEITTVAAMLLWFGYVIDTMYYVVYITVHKNDECTLSVYLDNIFFLLYCFYWLFIMVAMFSRTQKKANATATYVHDIWNKYGLKSEVDVRVRHLQLVAIRLLNTKLRFTAGDFFNLDWTFCHMMIAALTTYLVILIQFNF